MGPLLIRRGNSYYVLNPVGVLSEFSLPKERKFFTFLYNLRIKGVQECNRSFNRIHGNENKLNSKKNRKVFQKGGTYISTT